MAETSMRAATQIGALEYQLFAEWYQKTYGQNPPKNDANIVANPQYQFWKTAIRPAVWSPNKETQTTVDRLTSGVTMATPPPLIPTDTALAKTGTRVVSINGYDFMEIDGQIIPDPIGKTQTTEDKLTAWQKAQLAQQNSKTGTNWLQNQELNRRLANVEAWNREQVGLMGTRMNWEADIRNEERSKMASQYEEWRNRLMGELQGSPRSWIQYQELKGKANPYSVTPMSQGEEIQNTEQQMKLVEQQKQAVLKDAQKEVDDAKKSWVAATTRVSDDYELVPNEAILEAKARYDTAVTTFNAIQDSLSNRLSSQTAQWEADKSVPGTEAYYATPRPTGEGGNMVVGSGDAPRPKGIPTPQWLAPYLTNPTPYLTKQELAPISGQALNRITPTQLEQLKGYQDWTGQNVSDWLQTSQQQLTYNPNVPNRWTPRRIMR